MSSIQGGGALAAGLALGTTYVLSVGPNNLMIIREGLARGRVCLVSSAFLVSYVALLLAAYLLTDGLSSWDPSIGTVLSWLGLAAMAWFALLSMRAALRPRSSVGEAGRIQESRQACLRRVAAVAVINPLMYIEFLLIPAGICGTFHGPGLRLEFIFGLMLMSATCCYGYAIGGRACASLFRHQRALQLFDLAAGLMLAGVTLSTAMHLLNAR